MSQIAEVRTFIDERVIPVERDLQPPNSDPSRPFKDGPLMAELRAAARADGLWALMYSDADPSKPLKYADFAPVAMETGRSRLAPVIMNSTGPDSGNIDLLCEYGTPGQRERWLGPLLDGSMRSCFAMTEPGVASSDARNIETRIRVDGETLRLSGHKWWITQAAHNDCALALVIGRLEGDGFSNPNGGHAIVLVPMSTPGLRVVRRLSVYGYLDDHAELELDDVVVPRSNLLGRPGAGLMMAQQRLVGARLHHCMRMVGVAERSLEIAVERSRRRVAFGKRLDEHELVRDAVAESRVDIETCRALVLRAAALVDTEGLLAATRYVSMVKVAVPRATVGVIDRAVQICGGAGVSGDLPLAELYAHARTLRIADGPDDVHKMVIARQEYSTEKTRV